MKLHLENVGKVKLADIELNGITVVAGENNTGKSTIGKMLYCLFDTFYEIDKQVQDERRTGIERILFDSAIGTEMDFNRGIELSKALTKKLPAKQSIRTKEELRALVSEELKDFDGEFSDEGIEALTERIFEILKIDDSEIKKRLLQKRLMSEFGKNVANVNSKEKSKSKLSIKENAIEVETNGSVEIESYINLVKRIVYIDNPFALDQVGRFSMRFANRYEHNFRLVGLLGKEDGKVSAVEEIVSDNKLQRILMSLNAVSEGTLEYSGNRYVYQSHKLKKSLDLSNISAGIKSFTIIKTLIQNGKIEENGIVVLDEPEIHLHPEWQLKYAEIIVLLNKEFGTNILINTHSPYFLWAIENYVKKYEVYDKFKLYAPIVDEATDTSVFKDMTDCAETVYKKLADPMQTLENMEYE